MERITESPILGGVGELLLSDPLQMRLRPASLALEASVVTQEELAELMTHHSLKFDRSVPCPGQIAKGFCCGIRDVDEGQVAATKKVRQALRVQPIRLDPRALVSRRRGWGDDPAFDLRVPQNPRQPISGRARLLPHEKAVARRQAI